MKLKIPKQADIGVTSFEWKGKTREKTHFSATNEDGSMIYSPCEAWGRRKTQIEEAMNSGNAIECDKIEYSDQYKRWNVYFPRGSGGESTYRGRFTGGGYGGGYKGKPVSMSRYVEITKKLYVGYFAEIIKALGTDPAPSGEAVASAVESARTMTNQYWISVERNVTFPDNCEPRGASVGTTPAAAPSAAATTTISPSAPLVETSPDTAILTAINTASQPTDFGKITDMINQAEGLDAEQRMALHKAAYDKKKSLGQTGGGA